MNVQRTGIEHLGNDEKIAVITMRADSTRKLRRKNIVQALHIVEQAIINANDTVFSEKARDRAEWLMMFVCSMETLLSERYVRTDFPRVLEAFAAIRVQP